MIDLKSDNITVSLDPSWKPEDYVVTSTQISTQDCDCMLCNGDEKEVNLLDLTHRMYVS